MACAREVQVRSVGPDQREDHRGDRVAGRAVALHQAVHALCRGRNLLALERRGAQGVAQPAHQRCRLHAVPRDVADREREPPVVERDHVVPVAAHLGLSARWQVARGHGHTRHGG